MAAPIEAIIRRAEELRRNRSVFEAHWQEVRDYVIPLARAFNRTDTPGGKLHQNIYDSTGEDCSERLAAALDGMLTNPADAWFRLRPADPELQPDYDAAAWLDGAVRVLNFVFSSPRSQFRPGIHAAYLDLVNFGNAVLYVADRPGSLPLFRAIPLPEVCFAEGEDGRVDSAFRQFTMTARQALQRWGDKAGPKLAKDAEKCPDKPWKFLHAVYPRGEPEITELPQPSHKLPWASVWINVDEKLQVEERGYHEFPFVAFRWIVRAGEVYGRGPGMKALADIKMLQRASRANIIGAETVMHPPLLMADDGVIGTPDLRPGGITTYRAGIYQTDPIRALLSGARPDLGQDLIDGIRAKIEKAFYVDLLSVMQDPKMTATQVIRLDEETMRILGPVSARMQGDLSTLIDRTFGICLRAGLFPPPPESLQGQELRTEYLSPLARAQRYPELTATSRTLEISRPLIEMDPSLLDVFDGERIIRETAEITGMPVGQLRSPATVAQMRQARNETADQQNMVQTAVAAAPAAAKLIKAAPGLLPAAGAGEAGAGAAA